MNDPNQEATRAISERAFCGAIIRGDTRATDAGLKADWFTVPICRRIFSAALAVERQGRPCDLATLEGVLDDDDLDKAITIAAERPK